jgi:hypothetical protein
MSVSQQSIDWIDAMEGKAFNSVYKAPAIDRFAACRGRSHSFSQMNERSSMCVMLLLLLRWRPCVLLTNDDSSILRRCESRCSPRPRFYRSIDSRKSNRGGSTTTTIRPM